MNIILVAATKQEIDTQLFKNHTILITGIGIANSCIKLTKTILKNNFDLVINMGISGSFNENIKIGDVVEVIEDNFSEIGFEANEDFQMFSQDDIKTSYSNNQKTKLKKVKSITVNTVHGNTNSIKKIIERLNPDIENMEGAAIFKVCQEFNIPCLQIRSISNKIEKRNKKNWNIPLAINNLNQTVSEIIASL